MYPDLKISQEPMPGAIICWQKGEIGNGSDGAGHVAVVEEILERDSSGKAISIRTSESSYGGTAFFNAVRTYNNGNWVNWAGYKFRAFILNPAVTDDTVIITPVERMEHQEQIEIKISSLRMRKEPSLNGQIHGYAPKGIFNVLDSAIADGYNWYKIGDNTWVADCDGDATDEVEFLAPIKWTKPEPVEKNSKQNQVYIGNISLRIRFEASTSSEQMGLCEKESYYKCLEVVDKDDYTWYRIGDDAWCAGVGGVTYYASNGKVVPGEDADAVVDNDDALDELAAKLKEVEAQIASLTSQLAATKADAQNTKAQLEETTKKLEVAEAKLAGIAKIL